MEIIIGNLLCILTFVGMFCYLVLEAHLDDGPFRWQFCYCRKKNMEYSRKITFTLIGIISLSVIILYYGICFFAKYKGLPFYYMIFVFAMILITGFALEQELKSVKRIIFILTIIFTMPFILAAIIITTRIQLDKYTFWMGIVPILPGIVLVRENKKFWNKGDY